MQKEIKDLHEIIKDYRKEDGLEISKEKINTWINQFLEDDRVFILNELKHIFSKMYVSKSNAKEFLKGIINGLKSDLKYDTYEELLNNCIFLDLQAIGKSQKKLLELLFEVLNDDFKYDPNNLGSKSQKHNIYIDDVLCTGNTFYNNINNWVTEEDRLAKLKSKDIDLIVYYILASSNHHNKKNWQLKRNLQTEFKNYYKILSVVWAEDELLKPINKSFSQIILDYESQVTKQADEYAAGRYEYQPNYYRNQISSETFFSSKENRERLEFIFLNKGIEILKNSVNITKPNIRPLGYSLPSYKDFGFGLMFFTWRNIANNTPLVFWYANRNFIPLFANKR